MYLIDANRTHVADFNKWGHLFIQTYILTFKKAPHWHTHKVIV